MKEVLNKNPTSTDEERSRRDREAGRLTQQEQPHHAQGIEQQSDFAGTDAGNDPHSLASEELRKARKRDERKVA